MLKRLLTAAAAVAAFTAFPLTASASDPDGPPPQACGCTWMAVGYNPESGEFNYAWVCETVVHCIPLAGD